MAWLTLVVAGFLEVVWASALKRADEPTFLVVTVVGLMASVGLLGVAVKHLPMGMAYAVWVGIGIVGTVCVNWFMYGEKLNPVQMVFLSLIAVGIVGMKLTAGHGSDHVASDVEPLPAEATQPPTVVA